MPKPALVRLYPVPGVSVWPWPATVIDVAPEQAAELLAHVPPPFTDKPPTEATPPVPPDPTEG